VVVRFQLKGEQTGPVIEEHEDMVFIGFASSSLPNGIGIMRVFLLDTSLRGKLNELSVDQHIPSAKFDVGGGLQLLLMP
jgi:hypothetical protein